MMNRQTKTPFRNIIIRAAALLILAPAMTWAESGHPSHTTQAATGSTKGLLDITVYKSPTCGCCEDWVEHLKNEGFKVTSHDKNDMDRIKRSFGVKPHLASCHTATINGYVIEGHVPAADIKRLLKEKPQAAGLTAPGMPRYSPGMQPPGKKPRGYDVLLFDEVGGTQLFNKY